MHKGMRKLYVLLLALSIILSMSAAWADIGDDPTGGNGEGGNTETQEPLSDAPVNVDGSVTSDPVNVPGDLEVTLHEEDSAAVTATNGADVTVEGTVTAMIPKGNTRGLGISSTDSYVYVEGEVDTFAEDLDDEDATAISIDATADQSNNLVTVDGPVWSTNLGIFATAFNGKTNLVVLDNLLSAWNTAISLLTIDGNNLVGISGSVWSDQNNAIVIYNEGATSTSSVAVDGDIDSKDDAIVFVESDGSTDISISGDVLVSDGSNIDLSNLAGFDIDHIKIDVLGDMVSPDTQDTIKVDVSQADLVSILCEGVMKGGRIIALTGAQDLTMDDYKLPNITTWGMESTNDLVSYETKSSEGNAPLDGETICKNMLASINYIILQGETAEDLQLSGDTLGKVSTTFGNDYTTATAGAHTFSVTPPEGYRLKGLSATVNGEDSDIVTANSDGTYTITIPDGGKVVLNADLQKIVPSGEGTPASADSSAGSPSKSKAARTSRSRSTARSAAFVTTGAAVTDGSDASAPETVAVGTIQSFKKDGSQLSEFKVTSYEDFNKQIVRALHNSVKGGKIVIATDQYFEMDSSVVDELKEHKTVSLEIRYDTALDGSSQDLLGKASADGTFAKITVPAGEGKNIQKLEDKKNQNRVAFKDLGRKYTTEKIEQIYE